MLITSEFIRALKPFNKRVGKNRNVRVGLAVNTKRGVGIIISRDGSELWVAHESDSIVWYESYIYDIEEVKVSDIVIDTESQLYKGAWQFIEDSAINANQTYEVRKHEAIFEEYESMIPGKRTDRDISMGMWGSTTYRRYTGMNRYGQPFDFEANILRPFLPVGDRVLYAMGVSDGYITDMDGYGRIYRRKIEDRDVRYGLAKYAGPQET